MLDLNGSGPLPTMLNDSSVVSLAEYNYERQQSSYWKQKAESYHLDCQAQTKARHQAWKVTSQLQNLLKEKQSKIQELEKVINDFNLHEPGIFSPPSSTNLKLTKSVEQAQYASLILSPELSDPLRQNTVSRRTFRLEDQFEETVMAVSTSNPASSTITTCSRFAYEFEWEEIIDESAKKEPLFRFVTPRA